MCGANGQAVRQAVDWGVKGIVIDALGMGNMNVAMLDAAKYAIGERVRGRQHARAQRPRHAQLRLRGRRQDPFEAGAVMADDLRAPKARILLMLALQSGVTGQKDLQAVFDR